MNETGSHRIVLADEQSIINPGAGLAERNTTSEIRAQPAFGKRICEQRDAEMGGIGLANARSDAASVRPQLGPQWRRRAKLGARR